MTQMTTMLLAECLSFFDAVDIVFDNTVDKAFVFGATNIFVVNAVLAALIFGTIVLGAFVFLYFFGKFSIA